MESEAFKSRRGLSIVIPPEVAERYHLAANVRVEIVPEEEGIFIRPLNVEPWFSVEWEEALEAIVERYGPALEAMRD
jgi:bifunctional DNA-binding transcriptional regulator/antitoxin component of YhaV-PrlF toxin-antitoxin module